LFDTFVATLHKQPTNTQKTPNQKTDAETAPAGCYWVYEIFGKQLIGKASVSLRNLSIVLHTNGLIHSLDSLYYPLARETLSLRTNCCSRFKKLWRSKLALALPVTFLILFVSTLGIVAFTYYFSVERIGAQGTTLKVSTAKQNLLSLDNAIISTLWQPGSISTYELTDSGGQTKIQPDSNILNLCVNTTGVSESIFNASIGQVTYELPYTTSADTGLYLKGDARPIINQSGSLISQLCIQNGAEYAEILLRYRPSVTYAAGGLEDGRAVNHIRIYIANLNSSDSISLYGSLPLQIACKTTEFSTQSYQITSGVGFLTVTAVLDGSTGSVSVPLATTSMGGVIHLETVVSNIAIARWIR
jgi:hypothetical protein